MNRVRVLLVAAWFAGSLSGCSAPAPSTAPDPFSTVAQQADEAYAQGVWLYEQGRSREALDAFKRARLLSPTNDTRIDEMTQRVTLELTPTPTPAPPTATPSPEPTPVTASTATPATDLGADYFGRVFLTVVPGREGTPAPMLAFSHEDQIGLYIERLDQRLRMPFAVRVFNLDAGRLVHDARSDTIHRFQERMVWYHEGGEAPGRYRLELYADESGETLTHVFEYEVGTTPVLIPTPEALATPLPGSPISGLVVTATPVPAAAMAPPAVPAPPAQPQPQSPPAGFGVAPPSDVSATQPQATGPGVSQPGAATGEEPPEAARPWQPEADAAGGSAPEPPTGTAQAAPERGTGTVEPQPAAATRILVTGGPAALSFVEAQDQLFVADLSGLIWSLQHGLAALTRPFPVPGEPVAVAADLTNQRLYVTVRSQPAVVVLDARTGIQIASTSLPAQPGDAQLDSSLGVLYVVLPARNALELIDVHDLKTVRITPDLPGITDIAIDQATHTVYLSHLDGRISVIDGRSGQVRSQLSLSGPGLSGVATADGRVFAINQPAREVLEVDLSASDVSRFPLAAEPVSIVVGPQSGLVYVLDAITNTLVKLDSNDGSEVGRVSVGDEGAVSMSSLQPDTLWLRPRVVASASDERIFVIEPQSAALAVVPPGP